MEIVQPAVEGERMIALHEPLEFTGENDLDFGSSLSGVSLRKVAQDLIA